MADQAGTQLVERQLMPAPAPRPPKLKAVKVLDEDEWTEKIESIIQRDYFPDVPKLQNKLEWLQVADNPLREHRAQLLASLSALQVTDSLVVQALKSQDPAQLRQAQLNIQRRRAGFKTPVGSTPGTFRTPGTTALRTPGFAATPMATPGFTPGPGGESRCVAA